MTSQPPLNPDALEAMSRVMHPESWHLIDRYPDDELSIRDKEIVLAKAENLASAYVAAALPEVTNVEELDQLPEETVIRSVPFGIVRERLVTGWASVLGGYVDKSVDIAGHAHVVLYRPEVEDV